MDQEKKQMQDETLETASESQVGQTPEESREEGYEEINSFELEARKARAATQKLKKSILIVAVGMAVFTVVALLLLPVLDKAISGIGEEETTVRPNTVLYYDPDYEYDIMQDDEYLSLDRYIYYADVRTNETVIIPDDKLESYGPAVVTLKAMIDAIIAGDHEAYNALFSTTYFESDETRKLEPPFTMQQVYDIKLTRVLVEDELTEDNRRYTKYIFDVEYKIHKNNGTFRTDLGHDDSRKQRFVLSNSTSNQVLIDQIMDFIYVN